MITISNCIKDNRTDQNMWRIKWELKWRLMEITVNSIKFIIELEFFLFSTQINRYRTVKLTYKTVVQTLEENW